MKTIKQMLMTIAVLLYSVAANAYDFTVDGIYYKITSAADLTVSVTSGDNKYSGEVIIPLTVTYKSRTLNVTSINYMAFSSCSGLTNITLPNSITSIEEYAFSGCSGLTSITIPNSVTSIRYYAFYYCTSLTSVTIGNSVTSIGDRAFEGCTSLKDLRIEDGETTLSLGYNFNSSYGAGEGLFYDCPLESLYLGRNIQYETGKNYGYSPFYGNKTLKSVTIPNSVTSIGDYAFEDCSGLTSVTIGNGVTSIGYYAFYHCNNLKKVINYSSLPISKGSTSNGYVGYYANEVINAPNGSIEGDWVFSILNGINTLSKYLGNDTELILPENCKGENYAIGEAVFKNCSNLTSITIPQSVTSIGDYAFSGCSGLASITIPNSITSIGYAAFSGCNGFTSVTIGNGVTSIGKSAFYYCTSLTSVAIGNSVTSIGNYAFYNCKGLTSIYLVGTTPPDVVPDCFTESQYAFTTVYVPQGSLAAYQAADVWKTFWDIQEYDVTAINDVTDDALVFEITANGIQFTAAEGKAVAVYSAGSAQIVNISNYAGEEITLDKGVYILCVGNKTMKVRL